MKIAAISDTHGNLAGWEKAGFVIDHAGAVIHCGDVFGPGYNPLPEKFSPKTLLEIFNNFDRQLLIVAGNCETWGDRKMLEMPVFDPFLIYNTDNARIIATHGHLFTREQLLSTAKKWKADVLITGHSHRWKIEKNEGFIWVNPGSAGIPLNEPATALIDTSSRTIKVVNIDTKETLGEASF